MKRWLAVFIAMICCLGFAGCSGDVIAELEKVESKIENVVSVVESSIQDAGESSEASVAAEITSTPELSSTVGENEADSENTGVTLSQRNAVKKAQSYLRVMAFSHDGLVEQLEYEQYSHEDAVYGADNCGADWNEQAEAKAKSYLKSMAFSYSGLIEQLEFEGFTNEQAVHGVDSCGADWNEQAAKKAKSYLDTMPFSRDGLIDQLEFEGFTYDQAVYAVGAVGL